MFFKRDVLLSEPRALLTSYDCLSYAEFSAKIFIETTTRGALYMHFFKYWPHRKMSQIKYASIKKLCILLFCLKVL